MTHYSAYSNTVSATTWSAQYKAVWDAFTNKPSAADVAIQQTWLNGMVAGGYFAKAELLDLFSTPINTASEALINWKNPGTFNPSLINAPTFDAYQGFLGNTAGGKTINLNFNLTTNGNLISQNNICAIWGIGTDTTESLYDFAWVDATSALRMQTRRLGDATRIHCNHLANDTNVNANAIKHYAMSRGFAANYDVYLNLVKTNKVQASTGLANSAGYAATTNRYIRYLFLFSYLTEAEVTAVVNLTEAYLDNYGTGLI